MPINNDTTLTLLEELVAIESVNPDLVPGARGEQQASQHLQKFLQRRRIAAELEDAAPHRPNVVATISPSSGAPNAEPALMIVAHIDTVGAGDMPDAFRPRIADGNLYGRGALDIKSGVAAMCAAAVAVIPERAHLTRPFTIAAVVDEECNSLGTQYLLRRGHTADCAIVLEPTDLQLVITHKGYAWFEIVTHGRAAHGSLPGEGRDAIRMMGRVLVALDELEQSFARRAAHPRLGRASLHASLISGGQELSSYPAECRLQLERRMLPGETAKRAEAELRALLTNLEKHDAQFSASLRSDLGSRPAYKIEENSPFVKRTLSAVRRYIGVAILPACLRGPTQRFSPRVEFPALFLARPGAAFTAPTNTSKLARSISAPTLCAKSSWNSADRFCIPLLLYARRKIRVYGWHGTRRRSARAT